MIIHRYRWQSSFDRFFPLAGVLIVGLLLVVSPFGRGPAWIYIAAAVLVALVQFLTNHETARFWLSQIRKISPPVDMVLSYARRCLELEQVARGLDGTLKNLKHPSLSEDDLKKISEGPTADAGDDLALCCAIFAERLYGKNDPVSMAEVFEILYCDAHGQESGSRRQIRQISTDQLKELARILVDSGRLPELESKDRMTDLVASVLERLRDRGFKLQEVVDELCSLDRLWFHLSGYAGCLRAAGVHQALPDVDKLRRTVEQVTSGGFLTSDYERVAKSVLLEMSSQWIRPWAKGEGVPERDARNLEIVGLGIFSATSPFAALWKPVLGPLGSHVASNPGALDMLLAYLWSRSRPRKTACGDQNLADLARSWKTWLAEAVAGMGDGVKEAMYSVLRSDLNNGLWPTWLPIQRTIAEIVQQSEEIYGMLETLAQAKDKDEAWRKEMQKILTWAAGGPGGTTRQLDPDQLAASVASALEKKLRQLNPPKPVATCGTVPGLKKNLESFAEQFRPETRLLVYPDGSAPASFRERAARLGRKLEELSDLLLAETGGARGYLITFDQSRGRLADLIDSLKDFYSFEHYTRYSRIGMLRQGETFEDFYERFIAHLERELLKAIAAAPPREWEQIEVTVQQISLLHRHDFFTDATEKLKDRLPQDRIFTKVFRVPPSRAVTAAQLVSLRPGAPEAIPGAVAPLGGPGGLNAPPAG